MERLSQQKREVESELRVKDNEIKKLKFKIIALESAPPPLVSGDQKLPRLSGVRTTTSNM
jgi:hypothetical protein